MDSQLFQDHFLKRRNLIFTLIYFLRLKDLEGKLFSHFDFSSLQSFSTVFDFFSTYVLMTTHSWNQNIYSLQTRLDTYQDGQYTAPDLW